MNSTIFSIFSLFFIWTSEIQWQEEVKECRVGCFMTKLGHVLLTYKRKVETFGWEFLWNKSRKCIEVFKTRKLLASAVNYCDIDPVFQRALSFVSLGIVKKKVLHFILALEKSRNCSLELKARGWNSGMLNFAPGCKEEIKFKRNECVACKITISIIKCIKIEKAWNLFGRNIFRSRYDSIDLESEKSEVFF